MIVAILKVVLMAIALMAFCFIMLPFLSYVCAKWATYGYLEGRKMFSSEKEYDYE